MTKIDIQTARSALANLPEGTSHGEPPPLKSVYLPRSHTKAIDPNTVLVTGMRGAGKTFWWSALQQSEVRKFLGTFDRRTKIHDGTEVLSGFGVRPDPRNYPSKDVLRKLISKKFEARLIWRTVEASLLAKIGHPILRKESWLSRTKYVDQNPDQIETLFKERDNEFERKNTFCLILFDALDRCADEWNDMDLAIRGLLQTALDMRSYRRLRVKIFLRSDQVEESRIANFPDASKILSTSAELNWPREDLYVMLWQLLRQGEAGHVFPEIHYKQDRLFDSRHPSIPSEEFLRHQFHKISGPYMGRDPRRGFPYTWVPNHLADTKGRVSPRSFLEALRAASHDATDRQPEHEYALHYDSIKRGVQEASKIRVRELREDYPWVDRAFSSLQGMVVPCTFSEIEERWRNAAVLDRLGEEVEQNEVRLPPRNIDRGTIGIREDLESLGVFYRLRDGRVNIPDVFRVGYGLGRRGGVKPVR